MLSSAAKNVVATNKLLLKFFFDLITCVSPFFLQEAWFINSNEPLGAAGAPCLQQTVHPRGAHVTERERERELKSSI